MHACPEPGRDKSSKMSQRIETLTFPFVHLGRWMDEDVMMRRGWIYNRPPLSTFDMLAKRQWWSCSHLHSSILLLGHRMMTKIKQKHAETKKKKTQEKAPHLSTSLHISKTLPFPCAPTPPRRKRKKRPHPSKASTSTKTYPPVSTPTTTTRTSKYDRPAPASPSTPRAHDPKDDGRYCGLTFSIGNSEWVGKHPQPSCTSWHQSSKPAQPSSQARYHHAMHDLTRPNLPQPPQHTLALVVSGWLRDAKFAALLHHAPAKNHQLWTLELDKTILCRA
ncbi:hypothetical protein B0J11DRAFT_520330 [Dendryphion nanum]|uniref:Uncharacterized protein n=1 Tax=Dendryphion nanum TaxID=256645 RepID=A0A9P9IUW0_9PLEO|nr:hypothetical protein B0J11DRAFT_520330 [Dendryphion nanum]